MQRSAIEVVQLEKVNGVLEEKKRHHDVFLSGQVQGIQTGVGLHAGVPLLLDEILDDLHVAVEGSVEQGSVALMVLLVDPLAEHFVLLLPSELTATGPPHLHLHLPDVDLDEFEVPLEGELVQDIVALTIDQANDVNAGIPLDEFL